MATKLSTFVATPSTSVDATHYYVETANDGFIRPKTLAEVKSEIVTNSVLGSGTANTSAFLRGDRSWSNNISGPMSIGSIAPYAWTTAALTGALDVSTGAIFGDANGAFITQNSYWNGTNWTYKRNSSGSIYQQGAGAHVFYTIVTGSAGASATPIEKLRVSADGVITQANATSGAGAIVGEQTFRLDSQGAVIGGPAPADFFGTSSAISLEAATIYEISAYLLFLKSTAGTVTWSMASSSAPTIMTGTYVGSPVTGVTTAGTPVTGFTASSATTAAFGATGSLSTGVNHVYEFKIRIITNLATNFRLQLNQSNGTITPIIGSYYTVKKISATTGTFVA